MSQEDPKKGLEQWVGTKREQQFPSGRPGYEGMLRRVNLSDIEMFDLPFPLRERADLPTLKNSFKDQGQKYQIILKKEGEKYRIVAGFRRLKAMDELGYSSVMAIVYDQLTEEEMELFYLIDTLLYQEADLVRLSELLSQKGETLAKSLGIPPMLYENYIRVALASGEIKEALRRQDINIKQLLEILKSDNPQELLDEVLSSQISSQDVKVLDQLISLKRGNQDPINIEQLATRTYKDLQRLSEKIGVLKEVYTQIPLEIRRHLVTELKGLEETGIFNIIHLYPGAEHLYEEVTGEEYEEVKILPDEMFNSEVLKSELPVVVSLHLEGYPPSQELQQALGMLQAKYPDKLKFCAINIMESDLENILPNLIKIGKDFLVKNLPRIIIFWKGKKVVESNKITNSEEVLKLIRSVVK